MTTSKGSKVFWTKEENELVLTKALEYIDGAGHETTQAINAAQFIVLPKDRHRKVTSIQSNKKKYDQMLDRIRMMLKKLKETGSINPNQIQPVVPSVVTPPIVEPPEPSIPAEAIHQDSFGIEGVVDRIAVAFETVLTERLIKVAERVFEATEKELVDRIASIGKKPVVVHQKKPKVVIAGLIGGQVTQIKKEYGELLNLEFYNVEQSPKELMRKSSHCDRVILMTKFVSHQVQNVVRGHPGFMYVNGGLSELSDKLLEISCN